MSIDTHLVGTGLLRQRAAADAKAIFRWRDIPLLLRIVMGILPCLTLLIAGVISVSRTGAIPEISLPSEIYLPTHGLPQLPKDAECPEPHYIYHSCFFMLMGKITYLTFDPNTRMIVRTAVRVHTYRIGDLITAWGTPTGFTQNDILFYIYWGERSAILYTSRFRPESKVEFIQYDLDAQPASIWRGFRNIKKGQAGGPSS